MSQSPQEPTKRIKVSSVWKEARELVWSRRRRLALGLALIVVGRLCGLVIPASSKLLIDEVFAKGDLELLSRLVVVAALATIIQASSSFILAQLLSVAAQQAITDLKQRMQQHVIRLPVRFFETSKVGELISRIMADAEGIRTLLGTGLVQLIGGLMTASFAFVVLLYLNWRLTSITLVVVLLFVGVVGFAFGRLRPLFRTRSELAAQISGRLAETLGGIRIVKAYTAEKREDLLFATATHRLFRVLAETILGISAVSAFSTLALGGLAIVLMSVGGRAIVSGQMTVGELVTYVFFTGLMIAPMIQVSAVATQLTEAFAGLDRIREILHLAREEDESDQKQRVRRVTGEIRFENVFFEYTQGIEVLDDVSFTAAAGTTIALVGSSGSGKSTITSLVMSFIKPVSGRITIDGRDLEDLHLGDYRSHIAVVLQDNFLFDGTIRENIVFSDPSASEERMLAAAKAAHCDAFVESLADGYETVIGERGIKVSGGQRQRIAIARAILADPAVLILDEATSSLDSESERMIKDGLDALRQGRTTFVIAHRLSTITGADQILVIEEGTIVERGTHQSLLELNGRYRELYRAQYELEHDRFVNPGEDPPPEFEVASVDAPSLPSSLRSL